MRVEYMFQLDDNFLEDLGLGDLPAEQKKPFLQHIYSELEMRVGAKLSEGMTDEQMAEFESIIDRKDDAIKSWLSQYAPNYHSDGAFLKLQSITQLDARDPNLRAEYAATKWLEVNRPNYREVVTGVLDEIKKEISASRDKILGDDNVQSA
jgi:hypothetical protein